MSEIRKHPDLFTPDEAAEYLRLDGPRYTGVFAAYVRAGHLPEYRGADYTMFYRDELNELVEKIFCFGRHEGKEPIRVSTRVGPALIYFLYQGDSLVYIGQTIEDSEKRRTRQHVKDKVFDRVEVKSVTRDEVDAIERGLIALHKPPLNKAHKNLSPERFLPLLKARGFCE